MDLLHSGHLSLPIGGTVLLKLMIIMTIMIITWYCSFKVACLAMHDRQTGQYGMMTKKKQSQNLTLLVHREEPEVRTREIELKIVPMPSI